MKIPKLLPIVIQEAKRVVSKATRPRELMADVVEFPTKTRTKLGKIKHKLFVGLDKATVQNLEQMALPEFFEESRNIIAKSLGIPQELYPKIRISEMAKEKTLMGFDFSRYTIHINKAKTHRPKEVLFSGVNHEMAHVRQFLTIMRTEGLGELAIENLSQLAAQKKVTTFIKKYKDMPEGEILNLKNSGQLSEKDYTIIRKIKDAAQKGEGSLNEYSDKLVNNSFQFYKRTMQTIRNKAIETMGVIKSDSIEAIRARMYYEATFKTYSEKMSLTGSLLNTKELEAYILTITSHAEYTDLKHQV